MADLLDTSFLTEAPTISPDVQAERERKRMALLQEERPSDPVNIDREIAANRPIRPKGAKDDILDTSFLQTSDEPTLDTSFLKGDEGTLDTSFLKPEPSWLTPIQKIESKLKGTWVDKLPEAMSHPISSIENALKGTAIDTYTPDVVGSGLASKSIQGVGDFAGQYAQDPQGTADATAHQVIAGTGPFLVGAAEKADAMMKDPINMIPRLADEKNPIPTPAADTLTKWTDTFFDTAWKGMVGEGRENTTMEGHKKNKPEAWKAAEELFASPGVGAGDDLVNLTLAKGTEREASTRHLGEELTGLLFAGQMLHGVVKPRDMRSTVPGKELPSSGASGPKLNESDIPSIIKKLAESIDEDVTPRERYTAPEGMSYADAINQQLDARDAGGHNAANVIDLLADATNVSAEHADVPVVAQAYRRLINQLGLDEIGLVDHNRPDSGGTYFHETDALSVKGGEGKKTGDRVRTFLHEVTHGITSQLLRRMEEDPKWFEQSDRHREVGERVRDFQQVFEDAKKAYEKEHGFDPAARHAELRERAVGEVLSLEDKAALRETYGWTSVHEFASEIMARPVFREELARLKRTSDLTSRSTSKRSVKTFWEPVKQAFIRMLSEGAGYKGTHLETAIEHLTGLIDSTRAVERTNLSEGPAGDRGLRRTMKVEQAVERRQASPLDNLVGDAANRLAYELKESGGNYEMFRTNAGLLMDHPAWEAFLDKAGPLMWDNADQFIRSHFNPDRHAHLSEMERRHVLEEGTADDLMRRIGVNPDHITPLFEHEDVAGAGHFTMTDRVRAQHAAMGTGKGNRILKWFLDSANMYKNMGAQLYHRVIEHYQDFNALSYDGKKNFMAVYSTMDRPAFRSRLVAEGLQWATPDMLREKGMSEAGIKAYEGITKGLDQLHKLLDITQRLTTGKALERIPGYMPHFFDGAYKVFVKAIDKDGQGYVARVKGFNTRGQAMTFVKELESGKYDVQGDKHILRADVDPQTNKPFRVAKHTDMQNSLAATLNEHLRAYQVEMGLSPEIKTRLGELEMKTATGFSKHLIERSDVAGYRGEMGAVEGVGPMAYWDNAKLFRIWQDYAKSVTDHYKNTLFIDRVSSRLLGDLPTDTTGRRYYGKMLEKTPKLADYMWEYSYNFTGENLNHLYKVIDGPIQSGLLYLGLNPTSYRSFARSLRNFFSQMMLRVNAKNKIANLVQPTLVVGMLDFIAADLKNSGRNVMSGAEAFARAGGDTFHRDADMQSHVKWATDNHILDPQMDRELKSGRFGDLGEAVDKWTLGKVDPAIEAMGREYSFVAAMEFFRKVYPDDLGTARRAAANVMEMVQVNYDRSSRPLMYQNLGVLGELISPFAVFRNAWLGNMTLMLRKIAEDPKQFNNYRGFLATQLVFFSLAGVSGMMGFQEVNWLIKQANNMLSELNWPTLEEMMQKSGVPDMVGFGSLSAATKLIPGLEEGIDLGASMGALGVDDAFNMPLFQWLMKLGKLGAVAGREAAYHVGLPANPPTNDEKYAAFRAVAPTGPFIKSAPERVFKSEESPDVAWKTNSADALVERTKTGQRVFDLSGSVSIEEKKRVNAERYVTKQSKEQQDNLKNYVGAATDAMDKKPSSMSYEEALGKASKMVTPEKFREMVNEEYRRRRTTVRETDAGHNTYEASQRRYWRSMLGE